MRSGQKLLLPLVQLLILIPSLASIESVRHCSDTLLLPRLSGAERPHPPPSSSTDSPTSTSFLFLAPAAFASTSHDFYRNHLLRVQ